ncbi:hypothetical protein ACFVY9_33950 [Streptomyces sp. NPDC059544]|uniref:MmyB family transcriptional regulator n=1 Tax=Streptomyces sp. NPDC059544 TaxID=3346861 RepID=UPI003674EF5A
MLGAGLAPGRRVLEAHGIITTAAPAPEDLHVVVAGHIEEKGRRAWWANSPHEANTSARTGLSAGCTSARRESRTIATGCRHPVVGDLTVTYQALGLPVDSNQTLFVYSTAPGSASETALRLLATCSTEPLTDMAGPPQPANRTLLPETPSAYRSAGLISRTGFLFGCSMVGA